MKKRLAIICLGLAVAVGVGAVVYWALTPTPGVTLENFKRLHVGMTEAKVEAILGEKGEDVFNGWRVFKRWIGKGCIIQIPFCKTVVRLTGDFGSEFNVEFAMTAASGTCDAAGGVRAELAQEPTPLVVRIRAWLGI